MSGAAPQQPPSLPGDAPISPSRAISSTSSSIDVILAEYTAMRNEIDWLIKDAGQYQTYALGLVAVLPPAFALLLDTKQALLVIPAIIVANSAFCLFGYLFFRCHQEVYVVAAYLRQVLRPHVRQLTGSSSMWGWEEYKANAHLAIQRSSRLGILGNPRFVVMLRLQVFLLPAAVGVVSISVMLFRSGMVDEYSLPALVGIGLGSLINVGMVVVLALWFWIKGDLARLLTDGF
jgi:hypothetical protein